MQCHLETTTLPLPTLARSKTGADPFSYRPGTPLGEFMLFFDHAPGSKYRDDFEIAHSAYRLRKSQCFLKSAGRMTCTTCHNPHDVPRGERASAHYNGVCASCHPNPMNQATHPAGRDCVSCHMPKRRTQDVIHAVMTDHFIQRRLPPGDPVALLTERSEFDENQYRGEVVPYYPSPLPVTPENTLLSAIAQVTQKSDLARGLPRLTAEIAKQRPARPEPYVELGQALAGAGKLPAAIAAFDEALRRRPDSTAVMLSLGDAFTQSGQTDKAIALLKRAIQASPDEPLLWYQLGLAQSKGNHEDEAFAALGKAATLDPDMAEVHTVLGNLLARTRRRRAAEAEFQTALAINPDLPETLGNIGQLLGLRGALTEATFYLGRSIQLKPNAVDVRINYAVALAALGKLGEAAAQIDAAIRLAPTLPNTHYIKGSILEKQGSWRRLLAEMEIAIRLRPAYGAAHLAAGRYLKAQGKRRRRLRT